MLFLGTGAAELAPNPLCGCERCRKNIAEGQYSRKRSSLLVDTRTMIDFGPEVLAAAQQYKTSLCEVRTVFITHSHIDHMSFTNIDVLTMTPREDGDTMTFYLSAPAKEYVEAFIAATRGLGGEGTDLQSLLDRGLIAFRAIEPYRDIPVDGMTVCAVQSNHTAYGKNEHALNYLLDRGEKGKLLYVADSGLYSEENLNYLRGANLTELIMEGTWGASARGQADSHLNAEHFVENVVNMRKSGIVTDNTRIFVTHINSTHSFSHTDYQRYMDENAPQKITVAYDGLEF